MEQLTSSGIIGYVVGGIRGLLMGTKLGWGEFGYAKREVSGAQNINVSDQTSWLHPVRSHFDLLTKQSIWNSVSKAIK